ELAVARVVDDHIDTSEMPMSFGDTGKPGVAVGDIQRQRQHRIPETLAQVIERRDIPRRCGHLVATLERRGRPQPAEPTGNTGNKPYFRRHVMSFHELLTPAEGYSPG